MSSSKANNMLGLLSAGALCFGAAVSNAGYAAPGSPFMNHPGVSSTAFNTVPTPDYNYRLFETLQVRPLALSPNGKYLFAVNTPDNRLEIFRVNGKKGHKKRGGLTSIGSITVGMEPVSVAVRNNHEVWVVNHLSDSISIVKLEGRSGKASVVRTLQVGDEPRDIVFGGPNGNMAFITTAHRGQNTGDDPDLFNPATGRADVWVFDADNLGSAAGGERVNKLTLFADTPRALAVSADGSRVYAAPFYSGNQTTIASKEAVAHVYADQRDPTNPFFFIGNDGSRQPLTSRVVKYKTGPDGAYHWYDDQDTIFDDWVRVQLPDYDVFTIDATQYPPQQIQQQTYPHAGTTLFNMAVNPKNGKVYISNTEAHNDVRFEGHNPGLGVTSVRGNIVDSRITVLDPATGAMQYNNLNPHVVDGEGDGSVSVAFPQDMAVSADGSKLMVVAQGSGKLTIYDTADLEAGSVAPSAQDQIALSAGGPTGVVFDDTSGKAYVLTRFDNGISVVDVARRSETSHIQMFNPEPEHIIAGRPFLYDAALTSANGTQACASCHIGGDMDHLSWDLGNPGGSPLPITRNGASEGIFTFIPEIIIQLLPSSADLFTEFLPVKGPMTTQSLRGLENHGAMHWRGDRNGAIQQDGTPYLDENGNPVVSQQPDSGMFNEFLAFKSFNVAFPGLVGRDSMLTDEEMTAFTNFALEIMYPPNPIRALDNSLSPLEAMGNAIYHQKMPQLDANGVPVLDENGNMILVELPVDRLHNCNGCHELNPEANAGFTDKPGFFGTSGRLSFENLPMVFKVAHFRNMYQKVGMFASSPDSNRTLTPSPAFNPSIPAVRGYGYQPDGAVGSVEHHLTGQVFVKNMNFQNPIGPNPGGLPTFQLDEQGEPMPIPDPAGFQVRRALGAYLMAFDSNFKPIVGQQITYNKASGSDATDRIALMTARAELGECDLVAKANMMGREHGFIYQSGMYRSDSAIFPALAEAQLLSLAINEKHAITFTCVPVGTGYRIAIDRDADGIADGDESIM